MEEDGFWLEVARAYRDSILDGMTLPEDKLWDYAKERARHRQVIQKCVDIVEREGRKYSTVLSEEYERREELKIN